MNAQRIRDGVGMSDALDVFKGVLEERGEWEP
jgi:hypothetical protein